MQMREMEEGRSGGETLSEEMLRAGEWATSMLNRRRSLRTIPLLPLEDEGASVVAEQEQRIERIEELFSRTSSADSGPMESYAAALFQYDLIDGTPLLEDCTFDEGRVLDVVGEAGEIGVTGVVNVVDMEDMQGLGQVSTSTSAESISYNAVRMTSAPRRSRRRGSRYYGSGMEARRSMRSGALPTTAPLAAPYDRVSLPTSMAKSDTIFLILLGLLVLGIVGVISFGYLLSLYHGM